MSCNISAPWVQHQGCAALSWAALVLEQGGWRAGGATWDPAAARRALSLFTSAGGIGAAAVTALRAHPNDVAVVSTALRCLAHVALADTDLEKPQRTSAASAAAPAQQQQGGGLAPWGAAGPQGGGDDFEFSLNGVLRPHESGRQQPQGETLIGWGSTSSLGAPPSRGTFWSTPGALAATQADVGLPLAGFFTPRQPHQEEAATAQQLSVAASGSGSSADTAAGGETLESVLAAYRTAIEAVAAALRAHPLDEHLQIAGLAALGNMSCSDLCRRAVREAGAAELAERALAEYAGCPEVVVRANLLRANTHKNRLTRAFTRLGVGWPP